MRKSYVGLLEFGQRKRKCSLDWYEVGGSTRNVVSIVYSRVERRVEMKMTLSFKAALLETIKGKFMDDFRSSLANTHS